LNGFKILDVIKDKFGEYRKEWIDMAQYRKFKYSAGYAGTETEVIFKFADDCSEEEITNIYNDWVEEQQTWYADWEEISEEDIDEDELDEVEDCT